ncbi:anion permease [Thermoactinomyces vulgaris]|uniref:Anion permease n=1 Tax=Thermoactinomyces vulgaris TaxID=2026 RepID=A0ABS0QGH8_THEVU|nr:anion permease [Thermoactinomyces vulgaris]MBA4597232.1 anion permease [Thermoactinomyces vulgaris]MBH8588374.1 anion permease [Thermoactinomyces vulgaris]QBK14560.1 hypothetical protein AB849_006635 [Thermoactinomyces vulgaris]
MFLHDHHSSGTSYSFILPVAIPPIVVVFRSGYLRIPDITRAGFALNVIVVFIVSLIIYFLLWVARGIDLNSVPDIFKQ